MGISLLPRAALLSLLAVAQCVFSTRFPIMLSERPRRKRKLPRPPEAGSPPFFPVAEAPRVMALFEQMRANVGKLLRGIDRYRDRGNRGVWRCAGRAWSRGLRPEVGAWSREVGAVVGGGPALRGKRFVEAESVFLFGGFLSPFRYNPENLATLERYVETQAKENAYDLEANLAVLKL